MVWLQAQLVLICSKPSSLERSLEFEEKKNKPRHNYVIITSLSWTAAHQIFVYSSHFVVCCFAN
jgi:hypothetical protein